jgi:transposase
MLALATTRQGDVPLFCQALDGNASDQVSDQESLVAAVEALAEQLRADTDDNEEAPPIFVADSGFYSAANVARLSSAGVRWISRVPDTSTAAKAALEVADTAWQQDGDVYWASAPQAPTGERWVVVRTTSGEARARATLARQVEQARGQWEKTLWHLGNQRFAGVPDARAALTAHLKTRPAWLQVESVLVMQPKRRRPGRPRKDAPPDQIAYQILTTLAVDEAAVAREARRQAAFLVATNVLDSAHLSDQELIRTDKDQSSVERGFSFLKDPLFLASSVFVKKPERIVALSLVLVLCLLVYRLAEHRLREQLAATGQTVPNQLKQPTDRPTMRWIFPCFDGVSLVAFESAHGPPHRDLAGVEPLHEQVAALLGPSCENFYTVED